MSGSRQNLVTASHKQYFRIAYPKGTISNCDFFICLCENQDKRIHYIIPREDMPETGICLIPQAKHHESKYTQFKEAWERLKRSGLVFLSEPYAQLTTPRFRTNIPYSYVTISPCFRYKVYPETIAQVS